MKKRAVAIVLAAGQGKRMQSEIAKQYLLIHEKPILYHTLRAFEESNVEKVILVVGAGEEEFCKKEIVERYGFEKVSHIVPGGKERYDSVYEGLKKVSNAKYVLIHDGARPCITKSTINTTVEEVAKLQACVVGVPVKDTIKVVDQEGRIQDTPNRSTLWITQTPQAFSFSMVYDAYTKLYENGVTNATDDAMVVETMLKETVHMIMGSYCNIKVTTPEDMLIAEQFIAREEVRSKK